MRLLLLTCNLVGFDFQHVFIALKIRGRDEQETLQIIISSHFSYEKKSGKMAITKVGHQDKKKDISFYIQEIILGFKV